MKRKHIAAVIATVTAVVLSVLVAPAAQAATATASFTKVSDWGSGFEGKVTVTNGTSSPLSTWSVALDFPSGYTISSSWDATRSSSGQTHTFTPPGWAGPLAPGATFTFGFNGSPGNFPGLAACRLNGGSCTGGGRGTVPGAPGGLTGTPSSSSVSLSWNAASGATSYNVYRNGTKVGSPTGTSFTDSGLTANTTYSYQVSASNSAGEGAKSGSISVKTTTGGNGDGTRRAAPYLYMGWGDPPSPSTVMSATGIKWFTMAFILSSGGCNPAWDGSRPLQGSADANAIAAIRAAGGDIVPSIGGWSGNKLGPNCSTPEALAGAYQQVINAYNLKAIDIDIENSDEFESEVVQDRILNALKIVKQNNPGIQTILTFGTTTTGPNYWGNRLIERSAALGANIDVFTLMPFDFGSGNIYNDTVGASEGLKNKLKATFGWTDAQAYAHQGISGMNGLSDQQELTTPATWQSITDWARGKGLARLAFWSVNRDRPCPGGGVVSNCSGIAQDNWQFTRITAGF
ncbi:cellulose binding domain-containing protein [Kribbella sp. VKM Ac-2527]|uniref:Cellulose binding domain-containing protein n=1 Tax=Kribbella caucasensis TaxID=2512215 RepID=A0A4R6KII8_9ACTN|nr:cellulose binding domain-containing protein [Kribbella sp. VKM Ac-2527]TDO50854.1 cellulose binding domain-containing protein [Kribbella sp. VKM Ac-2527]